MFFMMRYIVFNKPFHVLSQFSPEGERKTLADFFRGLEKDIYPVGRLDYDSEGLLVLTNDKRLTHRLLDPEEKHKRTYLVQVEGIPDERALSTLRSGVWINVNGKRMKTRPADAALIDAPAVPERNPPVRFRKNIPTAWIQLRLTEGKNRQVRRMTAATGYPTLRLIRYSIGTVTIDGLAPGEYAEYDSTVVGKLLKR
jgi:23S rRNA pseudouridine2457 synthase